jgi:alpha-tubulin suppressor-like RCC1 family protein
VIAILCVVGLGCRSAPPKDLDRLEAHVTGLAGKGLVLLVNQSIRVAVDGPGTADLGAMAAGTPFSVAVEAQPHDPPQRCSVAPQVGTMAAGGAAVEVSCLDTHGFSGEVTGLAGPGLRVRLTVSGNQETVEVAPPASSFAFSLRAVEREPYAVEVVASPSAPAQTCSVQAGGPLVGTSDVRVQVICSTRAFAVGGSIAGLAGTGLTLQVNGGGDLTIAAGATGFAFPPIADTSHYVVTVLQDPAAPSQHCSVAQEQGTLAGADVTSVRVTCQTLQFAVVGSVERPVAGSLSLALFQGGPELEVGASEPAFTFPPVDSGTRYDIQVTRQPVAPSQACKVENGAGTVGGGPVSSVRVVCHAVWSQVAAGDRHSLAIARDGTLWAWGRNSLSQLGDGSIVTRGVPVRIGADLGKAWASVSAGTQTSVAIAADGTLWAWGVPEFGEIGTGSRTAPTPFPGAAGVTWAAAVASDAWFTLALAQDGTLWGTGLNSAGQLGNGSQGLMQSTRTAVVGGATWASMDAGKIHSLAIGKDGTLWAWGNGTNVQLGTGASALQTSPVQVAAATGLTWSAVAAGDAHSAAISSDGLLWTWGANDAGQLGNGSGGTVATPAQVASGPGQPAAWSTLSAGSCHTAALARDKTLWAWGCNGSGQVGNGMTQAAYRPVSPSAGAPARWLAASAGGCHTLAIAEDGTLWAWGCNTDCQLGNDCHGDQPSPIPIW